MSDESDSLALPKAPARDLPPPPPLRPFPKVALFLDFDGTLVDIAPRPDLVKVARTLPVLIERLAERLDGRLAVISGRALDVLDAMLGPIDVAMAGSHGGEFRPSGDEAVHRLADPLPDSIARPLGAFAREHGDLLVERKPFSMAVHYRDRPAMREALLAAAHDVAARHGAGIKEGKMVVEVVMPGSDKGSAVVKFMGMPLFAGARPYFIGDDATDEDAFREVTRFGGGGVLVGAMRATSARWRLESVAAVHAWLRGGLRPGEDNANG